MPGLFKHLPFYLGCEEKYYLKSALFTLMICKFAWLVAKWGQKKHPVARVPAVEVARTKKRRKRLKEELLSTFG